jgi:hypothetical protein
MGLSLLLPGVLVLLWTLRCGSAGIDDVPRDSHKLQSERAALPARVGGPAAISDGAAREALASAAAGVLRVIVVDREGRAAPGKLAVRTSRTLPAFRTAVDPQLAALDPTIVVHEHRGTVELPRVLEQWLELCASGAAGMARALLEPARAVGELRLVLDATERRIEVLVVAADLVTPLRGGAVLVNGGEPVPIDAQGRAHIELGERTELVLQAPGADPATARPSSSAWWPCPRRCPSTGRSPWCSPARAPISNSRSRSRISAAVTCWRCAASTTVRSQRRGAARRCGPVRRRCASAWTRASTSP